MKTLLREFMIKILYVSILGVPSSVSLLPLFLADSTQSRILISFFTPSIFLLSYITFTGLLSHLAHGGIKPGRFKRMPSDPVYSKRRLYGICWTSIFYFKPLYWLILSNPLLKKITFRMFGYRGDTSFTIYPDTWVRDLCVLNIGKNAYIANRACLGTNQVSRRGNYINVGAITIGSFTVVGFGAAIGPGTEIGSESEIGVHSMVGVRCRIGDKVVIQPNCLINHGAILEDGVSIGTSSHIGIKCLIKSGIKVPDGSFIPDGMIFTTQYELDVYLKNEMTTAPFERTLTKNIKPNVLESRTSNDTNVIASN